MSRKFLVSGISSGMGKAFAQLLERNGDELIAIVRKKEQADVVNCIDSIEVDFQNPDQIETKFAEMKHEIDAFVNFAALLPGNSYLEYDHQSLSQLFNINVLSPSLIIKSISSKIKSGGSIILLGSVSAQKGSYDDGYAASKGAIHSLVKSLALKFAAQNIRVVGVAPGMTENTRMTEDLVEGRFEHNLKTIPLGRAGQPEDSADLIYYLSTDHCKFMTGNMIDLNGGQYLR